MEFTEQEKLLLEKLKEGLLDGFYYAGSSLEVRWRNLS